MPSSAIIGKVGGGGGSHKLRKLQGLAAARHDLSTHVTRAADRSRTDNLQITNPTATAESSEKQAGSSNLAAHLQRAASKPDGLDVVIAAWPALPDAIRAGILAMVNAATVKP